jgi:Ca2+-binding EF-hand superfamily protein
MMAYAKMFIAIASLLGNVGDTTLLADQPDTQPLATVKVKQVQRTTAAASDAMPRIMIANQPPPATLPAERLPQYRVGYQRSDSQLETQSSQDGVRFVLSDPMILDRIGRPLIVDATILVGDNPFFKVREQVATSFAKASAEPTPSVPVEAVVAAQESGDDTKEPNDQPPMIPAKIARYRLATESPEVMQRYAEAIGEPLEDAEAAWLMTRWTEGPSLLILHPYYQSFRAQQSPVFDLLDQNRDGILSQSELAEAAAIFLRCDANRDGIVDVLEIASAAERLRDPGETRKPTAPLFWMLSDMVGITAAESLLFQAIAAFDTNQDGQIDAAEIHAIGQQASDLRLRVRFDVNATAASKLDVLSVNPAHRMHVAVDPSGEGVNILFDGVTLHVSAIESLLERNQSAQVSIGAVVDGYPLLPEIDPNSDGRFTVRELRALTERLLAKDRNDDKVLTRDECLSPIRLCIGRGGIVHDELANVRNVLPDATPEPMVGPEWFVRMDRNQDGDLTREEFPGTDEQFAELDADGDSLVSAAEANAFEKKTEK